MISVEYPVYKKLDAFNSDENSSWNKFQSLESKLTINDNNWVNQDTTHQIRDQKHFEKN